MDDKKESSPSKDVDLRSLVTKSASSGNVTFAISAVDVPKERKGVKEEFLKTMNTLRDSQVSQKEKLELLNKLVELSENIHDISLYMPAEQFISDLKEYLVHQTKTLRTAALRVLRYYMRDDTFIKQLLKQKIHIFISRALERDKIYEAERMQALKLTRKIMEVNCLLLPYNVIHSLVSIAGDENDNLFRVSIETLAEITIRNPLASAHCSGIKVILLSILDPKNQPIQESLVLALIYLLNDQNTRIYCRKNLDIGLLVAPLLDNFVTVKEAQPQAQNQANSVNPALEREKKWISSIRAIQIMLKSWTGLITLANHAVGLKAFVYALRLPSKELHDKVLDALFDVFRLTVQKNSNPFKFSSQSQIHEEPVPTDVGLDLPSRTRGDRHNLLNNYLSALLVAFIDAGLIEELINLGSKRRNDDSDAMKGENNVNISIKATLLLGELLYLTNTLLPSAQCARVQTLPKLVEYAASFSLDPRLRSRASSMLTNLHQYHHSKHTSSFYDFHLSLIVSGANKWKRMRGRDRRLDRLDEVKLKMDSAMDLDQLKNKIQESQVLSSKDYTRWKWDIISDLIEGPLNNPTLAIFACSKTKFVKRILSFLKPSKRLFCKLSWSQGHLKYVRTACQLLELLVSTEPGTEFLKDTKLLPEIADLLRFEIEASLQANRRDRTSTSFTGPPTASVLAQSPSATTINLEDPKVKEQRLLSPENILKTMAREYFTMLGTLSSSPRGLEALSKFKIFKELIELAEVPGRDDLCNLIMSSLDYNTQGDARIILGKALVSPSKVVRYLATRHMRVLLRAGVQDFSDWGIDFLVKQLNDVDAKVASIALSVLDEACDEVECLDSLIAAKPQIVRTMSDLGKCLWLRFLSRPAGFKWLSEINWIEEEMKSWKRKLNVVYVINLETALAEVFSPSLYKQRETEQSGDGVYLPPHFYGELAKTREGCDLLEKSKHIPKFISYIQDPKTDQLKKRAALWALGHIGSSSTGFKFLEKYSVLPLILGIAENSPCFSLRGTSCYILGMMSRVDRARELLNVAGWESPNNPSSCIAVPKDSTRNSFFKVPEYKFEGSFPSDGIIEYPNPAVPGSVNSSQEEIRKEILSTVAHLSNFISAESAARTLKRLRAQYPEQFSSVALFYEVTKLLGTYKFRLYVKKLIYDQFDSILWNAEALTLLESL